MTTPDALLALGGGVAYTVAAFGLWLIVGTSRISEPPRGWLSNSGPPGALLVELLECPLCSGFWVGVVSGALGGLVAGLPWWLVIAAAASSALYTAGALYALDALTGGSAAQGPQAPGGKQ